MLSQVSHEAKDRRIWPQIWPQFCSEASSGRFFDTHIRDACLNLCVRVITVGGNGNADQACWPCPKGALEIGGEVDPLACLSGAGGLQNQASAELI